MNNVLDKANATVVKAQQNADTLAKFAPFVKGEPKLFYVSGIHGARVSVSYKVRTIAELNELIAACPPVTSVSFKGTFAGVQPADCKGNLNGIVKPCDGVTLKIEHGHCVGKYPCDEHAMSARWNSDTPAGRMSINVDFFHNDFSTWPRIAVTNKKDKRGNNTKIIERWNLSQCNGAMFQHFTYGNGGDNTQAGQALIYFSDADQRNEFLRKVQA